MIFELGPIFEMKLKSYDMVFGHGVQEERIFELGAILEMQLKS